MSYIGACLPEIAKLLPDKVMPAARAMKKAGIKPYHYLPKEPLAMVNGTTTMTGIAVLDVERAWRILYAAISATRFPFTPSRKRPAL